MLARPLRLLLLSTALIIPAGALPAVQEASVAHLPPPLTEYKGRKIARTMHWRGAGWLLRETREKQENATLLMEALAVEPGQVVADVGCGNGFHTLKLAERVGPEGKVFAVDIQPEMLEMLTKRAEEAGLENVEPVLGTAADPRLPAGSCDLILLVDVYHEISYPEQMLAAMRQALKPDGRLALVEFRAEDPKIPIRPVHKMSKAQILKELAPNGLHPAGEYDELPWQHLMFFGRGQEPVAEDAPAPLKITLDPENIVASRLEGSWEADGPLTKRLKGPADPVWVRTRGKPVVFRSRDEVVKTVPAMYARFLKEETVYMAGVMSFDGKEYPFLLLQYHGNPMVLYFRERDGDPMGDTESFYLMLAPAKETADDLLFLGGDFNNQPFAAFRRVDSGNGR